MEEKRILSCTDCGVYHCHNQQHRYPQFCLTEQLANPGELEELCGIYSGDDIDGKMARAAARIEGLWYCQKTRVEETVLFLQEIGAKKVGIATCFGLIQEAKTFGKILQKNGISYVSAMCKIGGVDKSRMGITDAEKIRCGGHETMCNPILQARILNREKTDFNIAIGLCVGHDALFAKYSDAPVSTLIAKDRVLGHNPAAALYSKYYKKLYE